MCFQHPTFLNEERIFFFFAKVKTIKQSPPTQHYLQVKQSYHLHLVTLPPSRLLPAFLAIGSVTLSATHENVEQWFSPWQHTGVTRSF